MSQALEVTADTFEQEVMNSPTPVVVDLYADWCAPCQMLSQVLDQVLPEFDGHVKLVKVNTDTAPELAAAFRVSSIPMLAYMAAGKVRDISIGLIGKAELRRRVQALVSTAQPTDVREID